MQRQYFGLVFLIFSFYGVSAMDYEDIDLRKHVLQKMHENRVQSILQEKRNRENKKQVPLAYGSAARKGDQQCMEDIALMKMSQQKNGLVRRFVVGIYDGHHGEAMEPRQCAQYGGDAAAYAAKMIPLYIQKMIKEEKCTVEKACREAFDSVSLDILKNPKLTYQGTTALIAYVKNLKATFAWVGDSRAIVIRDGKVVFTTTDHKPDNPQERARIEADNALVEYSDRARINGVLPISRELGNIYFKPCAISTPSIANFAMESSDLIFLASNGVWDVLSNEEVAEVVMRTITSPEKQIDTQYPLVPRLRSKLFDIDAVEESSDTALVRAARVVRDTAYVRNSTDNITVALVKIRT